MNIWITIIVIGVFTYLIRLSMIMLTGRLTLSPAQQRILRFVPASVFAAIILPELLLKDNALFISLSNPRLLSGLVAGLVAWRTRNVILTLVAGMAVLLLVQAFILR